MIYKIFDMREPDVYLKFDNPFETLRILSQLYNSEFENIEDEKKEEFKEWALSNFICHFKNGEEYQKNYDETLKLLEDKGLLHVFIGCYNLDILENEAD